MKLFSKKTLKPVLQSADCIRKIEKPVLTKEDLSSVLVVASSQTTPQTTSYDEEN